MVLFPFFVHNCCISFCSPFWLSCVRLPHLLPCVASITFYCLYLIFIDVHIFSPQNVAVILWLLIVSLSLHSPCRCCIHCLLILFCVCAKSRHVFSFFAFICLYLHYLSLLFFFNLPTCRVVYLFFLSTQPHGHRMSLSPPSVVPHFLP